MIPVNLISKENVRNPLDVLVNGPNVNWHDVINTHMQW